MASRGINKVILVGNLGNDPETRFFPDGGAVTNASIATSESWKTSRASRRRKPSGIASCSATAATTGSGRSPAST